MPNAARLPRLILASALPRRQELLREAGYLFEVHPADLDEEQHPPNLLPADLALWLAKEKARAVAVHHPEDVVLAADTVVAFGDMSLGKPADARTARDMLQLLSGTTHIVITGVVLKRIDPPYDKSRTVMSAVRMRSLSAGEIETYVGGGEWQGKAGGYGIQDKDPFVTRQAGSRTNIVGLPMEVTRQMLAEVGVAPGMNKS